jgi:DNA-binding XRE family transcriptional regulator
MEHDDKLAAVVRSTTGSIPGGSILGGVISGGEAAVMTPELESGGGLADAEPSQGASAVSSGAVSSGGESEPKVVRRASPVDDEDGEEKPSTKERSPKDAKGKRQPNNVRRLRIERMMSKAELARRANLSVLTIDRVEKGYGCRMDSKRKILEALGLSLADRVRVFGEEE